MYALCYDLNSVHPDMSDDVLNEINAAVVTGLALVNQVILRHYSIPSIYSIRPRYHIPEEVQTGKARERWKDIATLLQDRWGDCKDLTAWRLAELWKMGVNAKAESTVTRMGRALLFHTYIRYPDGRTEDPAKTLGMP